MSKDAKAHEFLYIAVSDLAQILPTGETRVVFTSYHLCANEYKRLYALRIARSWAEELSIPADGVSIILEKQPGVPIIAFPVGGSLLNSNGNYVEGDPKQPWVRPQNAEIMLKLEIEMILPGSIDTSAYDPEYASYIMDGLQQTLRSQMTINNGYPFAGAMDIVDSGTVDVLVVTNCHHSTAGSANDGRFAGSTSKLLTMLHEALKSTFIDLGAVLYEDKGLVMIQVVYGDTYSDYDRREILDALAQKFAEHADSWEVPPLAAHFMIW